MKRTTRGHIQHITGHVKVEYLMGRVGPLKRWPLFTAESKMDGEGTKTTLHCLRMLTDKLEIDNPLHLTQEKILDYMEKILKHM